MKYIWIRGRDEPTFDKPKTYFTLGQIEAGKSTLLEHIGIKHLEKGATILDAFGSVDGDSAAPARTMSAMPELTNRAAEPIASRPDAHWQSSV